MLRTAQCHCGSLQASTNDEPARSYVCHCLSCQRRTGAIVHSGAFFQKSTVSITGEHRLCSRMADSGYEVRFHFCPNCGTTVYWESDKYGQEYGIAAGCFAGPSFPPPVRSVFEESKHPWLVLPDNIQRLQKGFNPDGTPMT